MSFKFSAESPDAASETGGSVFVGDGFALHAVAETFERETEWSIKREQASLILHLGGEINEIESEFDGRAMRLDPPMPGEFWIVPSGVRYSTRVKGISARYVELSITPSMFEQNGVTTSLKPVAGGFDRTLVGEMGKLNTFINAESDVSVFNIHDAVSLIIRWLGSSHSRETEPKTWRPVNFEQSDRAKIEAFVHDNLGEKITLDTLCDLVGESPHRFLWAFRNAFGSTPAQYIVQKRIRRARHLLKSTPNDLTAIALETGFSDHSHFSTTFKRQTGITPAEFRRF